MKIERFKRITRFTSFSAWRFLALVATDPKLDELYASLRKNTIEKTLADPAPWLTVNAIRYLETHVKSGMKVLEWGCGASTLWFEERGCLVHSIEHDEKWHKLISHRASGPSTIQMVPRGPSYWSPVSDIRDYDIVLIDGRDRVECARFVFKNIKEKTYKQGLNVIFDDSNRERYQSVLVDLSEVCTRQYCLSKTTSVELDKLTTIFEF